jgi:hypothetical protein
VNTRGPRTFPPAHLDSANFVDAGANVAEHDELFIPMNERHRFASGEVQRRHIKVVCVIGEVRPSGRRCADPLDEETIMLKTISAALLAVSFFAAPAFAGGYDRDTHAPTVRDGHAHSRMFNAYGWAGRDHHHHYRHHHRDYRHFRFHQHRHHHHH